MQMIFTGKTSIVSLLIEYEADVNSKNDIGETPLMLTARK